MTRQLSEIELVAIGDELLSGHTLDTNAAQIAGTLETLGLRVVRKTTVGDDPGAIADSVRESLTRTGAVITTGGLGPTRDDATKAAVAGVFGKKLEFRPDLWAELERRWAGRRPIPSTNRSQAEVPEGGKVLRNPRGTAPGLVLEDKGFGLCILLPGPPGEVKAILEESVVPYLSGLLSGDRRQPFRRTLRTAGIAESAIAEKVGHLLDDLPVDVAYLPDLIGNDIRLTVWGRSESDRLADLEEAASRLRQLLGTHVYGEGAVDLAQVVGQLLSESRLRVAVAESCTAGLIAKRLADWPGASDYFWGGLITYADSAKVEMLGVSADSISRYGAVSEQVAREMAEGVSRRSGVEAAIAVTGIAGPTGGSDEKPVGTVCLAVRVRDKVVVKRWHYPGTRDQVRARAAQGGLDLLRRTLEGSLS